MHSFALGACVTDQKSPTFNPQSPKSQSYIEWLFAIKPRDATTILDVSFMCISMDINHSSMTALI